MLAMSDPLGTKNILKLSIPPHPRGNIRVVFGKVCKSSPGLKRHLEIHKKLYLTGESQKPDKEFKPGCLIYNIYGKDGYYLSRCSDRHIYIV